MEPPVPPTRPHSSLPLFDDLFIKIIWNVCNLIKMLNVLCHHTRPTLLAQRQKNHIIEMINNRSEMRIMWDFMCAGWNLMEQSWNLINLMSEIEFNWCSSRAGGESLTWWMKMRSVRIKTLDYQQPQIAANSLALIPTQSSDIPPDFGKKFVWRDLSARRRARGKPNLRHNVIDSEVIKHLR